MDDKLEEIHPGEILREEFMRPKGISNAVLADALDLPCEQIEQLTSGAISMTPTLAARLAKHFDVSSQFWLNLQVCYDQREGNGGR